MIQLRVKSARVDISLQNNTRVYTKHTRHHNFHFILGREGENANSVMALQTSRPESQHKKAETMPLATSTGFQSLQSQYHSPARPCETLVYSVTSFYSDAKPQRRPSFIAHNSIPSNVGERGGIGSSSDSDNPDNVDDGDRSAAPVTTMPVSSDGFAFLAKQSPSPEQDNGPSKDHRTHATIYTLTKPQ